MPITPPSSSLDRGTRSAKPPATSPGNRRASSFFQTPASLPPTTSPPRPVARFPSGPDPCARLPGSASVYPTVAIRSSPHSFRMTRWSLSISWCFKTSPANRCSPVDSTASSPRRALLPSQFSASEIKGGASPTHSNQDLIDALQSVLLMTTSPPAQPPRPPAWSPRPFRMFSRVDVRLCPRLSRRRPPSAGRCTRPASPALPRLTTAFPVTNARSSGPQALRPASSPPPRQSALCDSTAIAFALPCRISRST